MIPSFKDYLCPCDICNKFKKALSDSQLDSRIVGLIDFESAVKQYSARFNIKIEQIPTPILSIIFNQTLKQVSEYDKAS